MPNRRQATIWINDVIFEFSEPTVWTEISFSICFMIEMYVQVFMASVHTISVVIGNLDEHSIHDGNKTTVPMCYHMITHVLVLGRNYGLAFGTTCNLWFKLFTLVYACIFHKESVRHNTQFISGIFQWCSYFLNVWLKMYSKSWL